MTAIVERAPGASRALVLEGGRVAEAHFSRTDIALPVGLVAPARLVDRLGPKRAVVMMAGQPALLDPAPEQWHQGQTQMAQVVRAARDDGVRDKQARAVVHAGPAMPAPGLTEQLAAAGHLVQTVPTHVADLLGEAGWDDVVEEAVGGRIDFPGGRLILSPTPAMLVIDVDGDGDLAALAQAAARSVAAAIRCHGIGGPVVVDFPSLGGRGPRATVDAILAELLPLPFEKTVMNGFGLVQIVRPRRQLSMLEEVRRPGFAALELLRRAMRLTGSVSMRAPQAIVTWLEQHADLVDQLARLTGGRISLEVDAGAGRGHVQEI